MIKKYSSFFKEIEASKRSEILLVGLVMFGLLLTYPLIRSTTDALFLEHFKARNSPLVWLLSSVVLIAAITFISKLQKKVRIQHLFLSVTLASAVLFLIGGLLEQSGQHEVLFGLYALKEAYIVMLVHMALAHLNNVVSLEQAKFIYGPLGAFGSLGGIMGGALVSPFVSGFGSQMILTYLPISLIGIGLIFSLTRTSVSEAREQIKPTPALSPLSSVASVWQYVMWIAIMIALTQFAINMGQFLFNLHFEKLFISADAKAQGLGKVFMSINILSLTVQVLLTPIILKTFKTSTVHALIPLLYLLAIALGFGLMPASFLMVGGAFVLMKGVDYSLFSAAKELLYFPLDATQKYGAKYIVDMVIYRLSKGLISTILIFYQSIFLVQSLLMLILVLWALTLIPLFRQRHRLLAASAS